MVVILIIAICLYLGSVCKTLAGDRTLPFFSSTLVFLVVFQMDETWGIGMIFLLGLILFFLNILVDSRDKT